MTGGRGFIGARLVDALVERGDIVRILDDGSRGEAPALDVVETFEADVRDGEAVRAACRDVDVAVHLAAVQGTGNFYSSPDLVLDVNLRGVLNIADACATEGVRRLVFSSSSEVYGLPSVFPTPESEPLVVPDPTNPRWSYGGSKIVGELVVVNAARRHGFEYVILRYHNVYGPAMGWDHVIPQFVSRLARGESSRCRATAASVVRSVTSTMPLHRRSSRSRPPRRRAGSSTSGILARSIPSTTSSQLWHA